MIKEITIYEKTNTNGVLYLYCESCKPRGGKKGTLVVSGYDQFCAGCGRDLYEMAQDVTPEPQIGDKVRIHGVGFGSGATGKVVSQVFHEQSGTTTRYCLVDLPNQGSIAFSINELQIIPLVQCPRCQCLVHEDELEGGCPICEHPEPEPPDDDELSPEDITAIEVAMSQPDLTYTEELSRLVEQNQQELIERLARYKAQVAAMGESWQGVISHAVPYDVRTYANERMTHMHLDYIDKYLSQPVCFKCQHIRTNKQCPRCHKPLCSYCEWGTLDMHVNACPECALVLRKEQEQPQNEVPLREAVDRLDGIVKRLVANAVPYTEN